MQHFIVEDNQIYQETSPNLGLTGSTNLGLGSQATLDLGLNTSTPSFDLGITSTESTDLNLNPVQSTDLNIGLNTTSLDLGLVSPTLNDPTEVYWVNEDPDSVILEESVNNLSTVDDVTFTLESLRNTLQQEGYPYLADIMTVVKNIYTEGL